MCKWMLLTVSNQGSVAMDDLSVSGAGDAIPFSTTGLQ
jgi:hypothetical protein